MWDNRKKQYYHRENGVHRGTTIGLKVIPQTLSPIMRIVIVMSEQHVYS